MKATICEHCAELISSKSYRVTSVENGVILLDMIVCASCALEAKSLELATEEIMAPQSRPALLTRSRRPVSPGLIG
jgi:RNase P subunit RPR2